MVRYFSRLAQDHDALLLLLKKLSKTFNFFFAPED